MSWKDGKIEEGEWKNNEFTTGSWINRNQERYQVLRSKVANLL